LFKNINKLTLCVTEAAVAVSSKQNAAAENWNYNMNLIFVERQTLCVFIKILLLLVLLPLAVASRAPRRQAEAGWNFHCKSTHNKALAAEWMIARWRGCIPKVRKTNCTRKSFLHVSLSSGEMMMMNLFSKLDRQQISRPTCKQAGKLTATHDEEMHKNCKVINKTGEIWCWLLQCNMRATWRRQKQSQIDMLLPFAYCCLNSRNLIPN